MTFFQGLSAVNYDIDISDTSADSSAGVSPHPSLLPLPDQRDSNAEAPNLPGDGPSSLLDTSESPTSKLLLPSPIQPVAHIPSGESDAEHSLPVQPTPDQNQSTLEQKPSESSAASGSDYQGFTAQGWKIQSIPCDTGTSDLKSTQTKKSKDDIAGKAVGVLDSLDKLL